MGKFVYKKRTADEVETRSKQNGFAERDGYIIGKFSGFKVQEANKIRILPPTFSNAEHFGLDLYIHYSIGVDKGNYLCLNKMKQEDCPICEAGLIAEREGDKITTKACKPTKRLLVWVIDRKAKEEEKDIPKLWSMPWTFDRDLALLCKDKETGEILWIDDPDEGYDVFFSTQQKGKDASSREYVGIEIARKASHVGNASILDFISEHPLDKILLFKDYAYIKEVFNGGSSASHQPDKNEADKEESAPKEQEADIPDFDSPSSKEENNTPSVNDIKNGEMEVVFAIAEEFDIPLPDSENETEIKNAVLAFFEYPLIEEKKTSSYKEKLAALRNKQK